MMHLRTELLKIVRSFDQAGIDYALCGGLAVAVHGYVRATKDIDPRLKTQPGVVGYRNKQLNCRAECGR